MQLIISAKHSYSYIITAFEKEGKPQIGEKYLIFDCHKKNDL